MSNPDLSKPQVILKHIEAEVEMIVPNWEKYIWIQINMRSPYSILYHIENKCPEVLRNKIEKIIHEQANLIGITAELHD